MARELKQRALATTIRDENVTTEMGAFTFSVEDDSIEIRKVPFVYVANLIAKVADIVHEQYNNYKTLFTQLFLGLQLDLHGMVLAH